MGFHDDTLPDTITFGTRGGPQFDVAVIRNDAGQEERIARWTNPLREYEAAFEHKVQYKVHDLLDFFMARLGALHSFRFKDPSDYATTSNGTTHLRDSAGNVPTVANDDEVIGTGDASETDFQLVKTYSSGGFTRTRSLRKPVDGTVKVAVDGVGQVEGTDYSVNYTTGVVTFGTAPGNALDVTAGCQFDVEVRFGAETNLEFTTDGHATKSTRMTLVEVRDQAPNPEEVFHGGSYDQGTVGTDVAITLSQGRLHTITPNTSGLAVLLPPEEDVEPGGPLFVLANQGADSLEIQRDDAVKLVDLPAGQVAVVYLSESSGGSRTWLVTLA